MHLTRQVNQKVTYRVLDGRLCIEHHIVLQQLTFRKKGKSGEFKNYHSYFIKLPRAIYDLLSPVGDIVYLKGCDDRILVLDSVDEGAKRVRIQVDNGSGDSLGDFNRYKISIPKKFIREDEYRRGESYMMCRVVSSGNGPGYVIFLKQFN